MYIKIKCMGFQSLLALGYAYVLFSIEKHLPYTAIQKIAGIGTRTIPAIQRIQPQSQGGTPHKSHAMASVCIRSFLLCAAGFKARRG